MAPSCGPLDSFAGWKRLSLFVILAFVVVYIYIFRRTPQEEETRLLNILCFGDSLTEGMTNRTFRVFHPYSRRLQLRFDQLSKEAKHRKLSTNIHNAGVSGEIVQKSMERRLPVILEGVQQAYDWVVVLGGTNDISRSLRHYSDPVDPKMLFEALRGLHLTCHEHGSKTMAVTIPARQCEVRAECSEAKEMREQVNTWLRQFAGSSGDQVVLVDLAREMDFPKFRRYWGDEVHFTREGYDKMGDMIFETLQRHLP